MKLISWNVNGLRACLTHDFAASFAALDADIFSVQETKMQPTCWSWTRKSRSSSAVT